MEQHNDKNDTIIVALKQEQHTALVTGNKESGTSLSPLLLQDGIEGDAIDVVNDGLYIGHRIHRVVCRNVAPTSVQGTNPSRQQSRLLGRTQTVVPVTDPQTPVGRNRGGRCVQFHIVRRVPPSWTAFAAVVSALL